MLGEGELMISLSAFAKLHWKVLIAATNISLDNVPSEMFNVCVIICVKGFKFSIVINRFCL